MASTSSLILLGNWSVSQPFLVVAAVGIDTAEQAGIRRYLQFMLEGMTRQGGVVDFDIELEIVEQIVLTQKANHCFAVVVVLMFWKARPAWAR